MIAYIIPSACYLKLRRRKGLNRRIIGAWLMLVFSSVGCVVCTVQAFYRVVKKGYAETAGEFFEDDDFEEGDDGAGGNGDHYYGVGN